MKQQLKNLFLSNTEKHEVHVTSDGVMFFERSLAVTHSKTLPEGADQTVTTYTRTEVMKVETDADLLEAIAARQKAIREIAEPLGKEYQELDAQKEEILERAGKSPEDQADLKAKEEAEAKAQAEAKAEADAKAEAEAKAEADAKAESDAKAKAEAEAAEGKDNGKAKSNTKK